MQNTPHNNNGPFNETNHQGRTTILYYNGIGQQTNVQQNHTYTATTHGIQRGQQQQNKILRKNNGKSRNKKSKTANNDKKNKPIARTGLDVLFRNQTRNQEN